MHFRFVPCIWNEKVFLRYMGAVSYMEGEVNVTWLVLAKWSCCHLLFEKCNSGNLFHWDLQCGYSETCSFHQLTLVFISLAALWASLCLHTVIKVHSVIMLLQEVRLCILSDNCLSPVWSMPSKILHLILPSFSFSFWFNCLMTFEMRNNKCS